MLRPTAARSPRTLQLLVLLVLTVLTSQLEVVEEDWEELSPNIAALHHLKDLSQHVFREKLEDISELRGTSSQRSRIKGDVNSLDPNQNPMSLLDGFQRGNFTTYVIEREQDFDTFVAAFEEQKTQDLLVSAEEISYSYSQQLLVMTDKERSTNDTVQQEYNTDPHHSVIISKECLHYKSCLPVVDRFTVVKIFGSVAADGQTVSGLSGSSLAELILKPSLENAPLFSLHANTTKDFQRSFVGVFMLRGIKGVLETKQENDRIYQIMNERGSVSSYRVPPRPVDHTTQYDQQHILIMENDPVVIKSAANLYMKHPAVSSVYTLDENQQPKLIYGDSVPLSEDSRLMLVGHGAPDSSGEMRLARYTAQDVAKIIERMPRVGDEIKTTSVVACEVGSDKAFIKTLMNQLHETGIKTELHVRDAVLQVSHTGQKMTQEITPDGVEWRHKDDSKKVVATLDKNGDVIIRDTPGGTGRAVFTNERNVLMDHLPRTTNLQPRLHKHVKERFKVYRDSWPSMPKRFIDNNLLENLDLKFKYTDFTVKYTLNELEALTWGFFKPDPSTGLKKVEINNIEELREKFLIKNPNDNRWLENTQDEPKLREIISKCYEIKSGEDVKNIIRHYAKNGENEPTYLMVNDWISVVDPQTLYVYPVGKKLGNTDNTAEVKESVEQQKGQESYPKIREAILNQGINHPKERFAQYVTETFKGQRPTDLPLSTEAWFTTYFTASIISESARNFRTFPEVLMALSMFQSNNNNNRERGLNFFFDDHPMTRGGTWVDPSRRGFTGSATPRDSSKLNNISPKTEAELMKVLTEVVSDEYKMVRDWYNAFGSENVREKMADIAEVFNVFEGEETRKTFLTGFTEFQTTTSHQSPGSLGGYDDGYVEPQDLDSASGLEKSFRLESHYSRVSALFAEEIHNHLREKYGENLAGLSVREGSVRLENGQIISQLEGADTGPVEFRVELSSESQHLYENMLKDIDTTAHDLEVHSSGSSHQVNKYVEHTGTAVGALGLMLGMKGAVHAFEEGDIKDGVVGSLQTVHGVTSMTMAVVAKQALSSETRIAKAAAVIMRGPGKGVMEILPVVGIGFGIYNFEQDLERGDTLGYIDATIDGFMVGLDVVETAVPELAPIVVPINVVLSVVRMVVDDVYMGIQDELNSLPNDAGILDKLVAVSVGFGKGIEHFEIHVASFFYDWRYDEIEEGHKLVAQISDYTKYYEVIKEQGGTTAIDFSSGGSSWNGGGIDFCLADQGLSQFCMNYFVSSDEDFGRKCWEIDAQGSNDIILGLGESHQLEYKTLKKYILTFIPAGSVEVVSGYKPESCSRYGTYKGNKDSNRFFAVHNSEDQRVIELMLSYYYKLYGEPGDDIFFLGPQLSYVEGSGGQDTYVIPENGGETTINNYDPSKAQDTLHFSVNYEDISVSKSGDDVVFLYKGSHTVKIQNWFSTEVYRHMNLISGDGVVFDISTTVISSVRLVAKGINKMFKSSGETVNASQPLLRTVTSILGSRYDDVLIGNGEKNVIDGGGGQDRLIGGEGEDIYKTRNQSSVTIENYARDNETDHVIIEANLVTFKVKVEGDNVILHTSHDHAAVSVTLVNWFRSPEDRHLLVITKDLVTFTVSDNKADCQQTDPFTNCIKSRNIDYSSRPSPLVVDLQANEALDSMTEVRGSEFNDVIRGNKQRNVIVPGKGDDFIEGRGGEDWYVITPGQGLKTINNLSPDLAVDILFLKEQYKNITWICEGPNITILVSRQPSVILQNWFDSKKHQHLQIKTSDGITAGLTSNRSSCGNNLMLPLIIDYRNQKPEPLGEVQSNNVQRRSLDVQQPECFTYRGKTLEKVFCGCQGKVMMNNSDSVKEMYGSPGFDIMVGNINNNLVDPYSGGALMCGGEGKDTYVIKHGNGTNLMIDNFAEDHNIDMVLIDMNFVDGDQVALNLTTSGDVDVTITTRREQIKVTLLSYNNSYQHQHLAFQSSDGVNFRLKSINSTGDIPFFEIEAFKVTLKQSQPDCHLDLRSHANLSTVYTVQGCPSQSNNIQGNDQDNALIGGGKDDVLEGGEGDDSLIGGSGADLMVGGLGDDTLYGEDGNDTMMGNSGRDVFIPGPGADLVDGGSGRDTVLYRGDHEKGEGVYVNLLTGQGRYADAEGDVLKDVETVIGTIYSDILVSGHESALLKGSDGNDILVSTGGDYLVGGDGHDVYMLAFHRGSVTIDNCANDNATDVLYLGAKSPLAFNCQLSNDRVALKFFGVDESEVIVVLKGWISDNHRCGHLVLVFRQTEMSVDRLLQECRQKWKEESVLISNQLKRLGQSHHQQFVHVKDLINLQF